MLNMPARKPRFIYRWVWRSNQGTADWCYPMSVDCNIYQTGDIFPILKQIAFESPNVLEGRLAENPIKKMYMQCYSESKIINIPANTVQDVCKKNRSAATSCIELNKEFLKGRRLEYRHLDGYKNTAVHEPMELIWR
jgi:hypothetical protein